MSPRDAEIIALLDKPLPDDGFPKTTESPLRDVAAIAQKIGQVPVEIDIQSLENAGLDADTPVTSAATTGGSLGGALRTILHPIDLMTVVRYEAIVITTEEQADEYLLVGSYPLPMQVSPQPLIDLIQGTVSSNTWETVGGSGAIRVADEANVLVVSQTLDVHMDILRLMRTTFDGDLVAQPSEFQDRVPIRVYRLRDQKLASTFITELVGLCNDALGKAADPNAKVSLIGGNRLLVHSASRPFQVYAGELIASLDGVAR